MVFPLASFLLFYTGETAYLFMRTREEKRQIRGAFSHYVPEKVVQEILAHPENLALGGEEREVSVLFSDLADFTSLSEKIPPAELVLLLNDYLSEMSEIILDHDGIIDKYEGDAIMAEFGVPIRLPDHAGHACAAAIRMQQRLASLRVEWTGLGRPQLRARIGINSGRVIAGNMGSRDVFDYTVLGDAVNLGSRLEGANKFYGTEIIISQDTLDFTGDEFHTRMLDRVRVKGKREVISIHELIAFRNEGLPAHLLELLRLFQEGMLLYQKQDWTGAEKIFKRCQKLRKDDGPARIYLERCRSFAIAPPPSDWDGVTEFHTK